MEHKRKRTSHSGLFELCTFRLLMLPVTREKAAECRWNHRAQPHHLKARLLFLEKLDLAETTGSNQWRVGWKGWLRKI
jgi:hypothetical protein